MSENQTTEEEFDAFSQEAQRDAIPAQADSDDAFGGLDFNDLGEEDDLDDLFAGADFDLGETESDEEVRTYSSVEPYDNPLKVGIKDKMWVAVRLADVAFVPKHKPRFPRDVCVAVTVDPKTGKKKVAVPYDAVEKALKAGATEVIRDDLELPYFTAEANHVAPEFQRRRYAYDIEVPALTIKSKARRERRDKKTGFPDRNGYSLRKATGATSEGDKVNLDTLPDIAARMDGQIVLAQITINSKPKRVPRRDPVTGKPISVLVNEEAEMVTVIEMTPQANEDGSKGPREYMLNDNSGSLWEGDPKLLVPLGDGSYAIADSGEQSSNLMEEQVVVTDYINPPFLPLPDRMISVEMIPEEVEGPNGETIVKDPVVIEGEITYKTIGAIAQEKTSGTPVDVLLKTGKTITAVWVGTQWVEMAADGGLGGGLDQFSGVEGL